MKKLAIALLFVFAAIGLETQSASAQDFGFGFQPFGFYQPYGVQYSSSVPTPPYFALNPPVYYGSRYARPYGISPFAAPPTASAPCDYQGHPATQYYAPPQQIEPSCNPYVSLASANSAVPASVRKADREMKVGAIQLNPYVDDAERIARR